MPGRPTKLNPETHARIVEAIAAGNTRAAAAHFAKIGPRTLYMWLSKGENAHNGSPCKALYAAVKEAENTAEMQCVEVIRLAMHKSWQAAAWWLERRRPQDWARHDRVELVGKEGGPIPIEVIDQAVKDAEHYNQSQAEHSAG